MTDLNIYANQAYDDDGIPVACLGIDSVPFSLHLWIYGDQIDLIPRVREANWDDRQSLRIGRTAGTAAFWSADAELVSILLGKDDESWDVALRFPVDALDRIYSEVSSLKTWVTTTPRSPLK
jgi:hypothetical protein